MILQCPNCNARYVVPDPAINASGRTVRCARCAHTWFESPLPSPIIPVSETPASETPINENPDLGTTPDSAHDSVGENLSETPAPIKPLTTGVKPAHIASNTHSGASFGLKIMVLLVAILIIALELFIAMPDLITTKLGMQPSAGLVFADIKMDKRTDDKANIAEISGIIMNNEDTPHLVPTLRVMLLDVAGNPLQFWEYKGKNQILNPKETMPFSTGELDIKFTTGKRFVVELGTGLELALRRKP